MITSCNLWVKSKGSFLQEVDIGSVLQYTCTADMGLRKGRAREGEMEKIERGLKRHLDDGGNSFDSGLLGDSQALRMPS